MISRFKLLRDFWMLARHYFICKTGNVFNKTPQCGWSEAHDTSYKTGETQEQAEEFTTKLYELLIAAGIF